jgi:hypothetical protein
MIIQSRACISIIMTMGFNDDLSNVDTITEYKSLSCLNIDICMTQSIINIKNDSKQSYQLGHILQRINLIFDHHGSMSFYL